MCIGYDKPYPIKFSSYYSVEIKNKIKRPNGPYFMYFIDLNTIIHISPQNGTKNKSTSSHLSNQGQRRDHSASYFDPDPP